MAKKVTKQVAYTELYLIAPVAGEAGPTRIKDPTVKDQSAVGDTVRAIFGGRKEIVVDSATVTSQINNYITVLRSVAESAVTRESEIRLSEITLSLTLSASGNIGIASTSAEAGITLVFKRS